MISVSGQVYNDTNGTLLQTLELNSVALPLHLTVNQVFVGRVASNY